MDLRGFLTCIGLWLCSTDGYNTINHFYLWLQCRQALKGDVA